MSLFFFFNDTATTEIYTLSLHDALPICEGLGEHPVVATRHEVERPAPPRHPQALRLRIIALRRATITTSSCWFRARCTNVTMPHCGRERDSRLSTTSVSE